MSPALTPFDVATHWPFIRDCLVLDRKRPMDRALHLVADAQVTSDGNPATLGRARIHESGLTDGEAGRVTVILRELEKRRVLVCHPGRGRRPHAWSFQPDLRRWQAMPWRVGPKDVVNQILLCPCRAIRMEAARLRGGSVGHMRNSAEYRILDSRPTLRPGLFPVDSRRFGTERAEDGSARAQEAVDSRDNGVGVEPGIRASFLSSNSLILSEAEEERFAVLKKGAERRTRQDIYSHSAPERELQKLATRLTDRQAEILVARLWKREGKIHVGNVTEIMEDISVLPEIKRAGREDGGAGTGTFGGLEIPEEA